MFKANKTLLAAATLVLSGSVYAQDIPVTAGRLDQLLVDQERRAPAIVVSSNRAVVTAQVTALVSQVQKDVGDSVKKGEILIRLDDANARLSLAQANASLDAIDAQIVEAESRLAKAEELLGKNFISDEELTTRRANLAVLQANRIGQLVAIEMADLELSRTRISAPYNAAIVERQAQVGSYAQPGTPLITLVQTDSREIDVELDPRFANDIADAQGLAFDSQGARWPVEFARVSDVIDSSSRVMRARFTFADSMAPIGSSGQLVWQAAAGLVPTELVVRRGSALGVFVADGSSAKFVEIPDAQAGRPARAPLPGDTLIVTRGQGRLQDGDQLEVTVE